MIFKILVLFLLVGAFLWGYHVGATDYKGVCVQTQNYLSTPYLANPNNLNVEKELEIVNIEEKTLS